jgi:hypothetical protein
LPRWLGAGVNAWSRRWPGYVRLREDAWSSSNPFTSAFGKWTLCRPRAVPGTFLRRGSPNSERRCVIREGREFLASRSPSSVKFVTKVTDHFQRLSCVQPRSFKAHGFAHDGEQKEKCDMSVVMAGQTPKTRPSNCDRLFGSPPLDFGLLWCLDTSNGGSESADRSDADAAGRQRDQ